MLKKQAQKLTIKDLFKRIISNNYRIALFSCNRSRIKLMRNHKLDLITVIVFLTKP